MSNTAPAGEIARAVGDITVLAVVVVIAIILVVAISMYLITGFLSRVVGRAGKSPPSAECGVWLRARQAAYSGAENPATGAAYTPREAAAAAVLDAAAGKAGARGACPAARPPPAVAKQDPYAYFLAGQR